MLLIEYEVSTGIMLGGAMNAVDFVELPENSASCIVDDEEMAAAIWFSHVNGGEVVIAVDEVGQFLSADIEVVTPIEPETPKTPEQLRIEQLEAKLALSEQTNLDTMDALFDVYLMVLDLQAAGGEQS
ncbi:hypothetical protein [Paenibacillus sinopodophylli]|uniref:hypothetical protein n=1 Tax=Paenibacillus sinopodophylli TaxID=1837342 RepID=UPI00110CD251|nr:hypothetical protein [Paenibacillus sinopodophylli]